METIVYLILKQEKMLVQQSKNSYIRTTKRYGYITNQLTRHDRCYDEFGADILRLITREAKDIEEIIRQLLDLYEGVDYDTLKKDVTDFVTSLANDHFVVLGESIEEIIENDDKFTYDTDNPKTLVASYYQHTDENVSENTQDFFLEEVQGHLPSYQLYNSSCQVVAMNVVSTVIFQMTRRIMVLICLQPKSRVSWTSFPIWAVFM